jgi:hypothetical protein
MSRFNAFLRQTGGRLALPSATKSLILVEIASDLEDLFEHYRDQGLSEADAVSRAEEKVDISAEALAELVRVHSSARGWTDRISSRPQPFWERIAMVLIALFLAIVTVEGVDSTLVARTSAFVWPVLAILAALVAYVVVLAVRMAGERDHRRLRETLATPVFLGIASLVVGFGGLGIEVSAGMRRMAADVENAHALFARAFFGASSTLTLAIVVALLAGLVWFVAAGRVARLERRAEIAFKEVA